MRKSPVRFTRRRMKLGGAMLAVAFGLWLISSFAAAYFLTRRPRVAFAELPPVVSWGEIEPHRLDTSDGQAIGAWFVEGPVEGPSVLLLHGNGGSRGSSLELAEMLSREGCSVLAISLRAHGDSTGDRNDFGFLARANVIAAVAFLERRRPGRPIVIQGTSLGAAAASYAAGELGDRINGYMLESPYRDIRTAVRNRTSAYLPRPLNFAAYGGLLLMSPLILPHADIMAPADRIAEIPEDVPILLLACGRDDRARPEEIKQMYDRVATHARLLIFEDAGHELFWMSDPGRYRAEIVEFLREAAERPRR